MESKFVSIEDIRHTLDRLRQDVKTQRRFPRALWDAIFQLTKKYPVKEVCSRLEINPTYLHRKIQQSKEQVLEFREIHIQVPLSSFDMVTIELNSTAGLKARIQGPISCLDYLQNLFGR